MASDSKSTVRAVPTVGPLETGSLAVFSDKGSRLGDEDLFQDLPQVRLSTLSAYPQNQTDHSRQTVSGFHRRMASDFECFTQTDHSRQTVSGFHRRMASDFEWFTQTDGLSETSTGGSLAMSDASGPHVEYAGPGACPLRRRLS
eukprot:415156_1